MKSVIYYRVSTKLQEDKYSLRAQKEELTKYAASQGWEVLQEFKDVDSGGKLDKKGLNALMDFVEDRHVDVVLCIDQDRLSRLDTVNWEFLKDVLRTNGVKIAEPGSVIDLGNEDDEFLSDIKNLIAIREKRNIVRRMMRGKRQRTREGKGWGAPPAEYLYDKITGTYSINEVWSWIIPFIDDLYLAGSSDGEIAKELNKITRTPNGKIWSSNIIGQKLKNPAYCGTMIKRFSNGEVITVENIYPPLRTKEQFEKILAIRQKKYRRKPEGDPHILRRSTITCAACGRKLIVTLSGMKEYRQHFYITHSRQVLESTRERCDVSINSVRVDQNIIKALKEIVSNEQLASQYIKLEHSPEDLKVLETEINNIKKQISDTRTKMDRLLPLYLSGEWSKEQLDIQKNMLEQALTVHENRQGQLISKRDLIKANLFNYDIVLEYLNVAARFDTLLDLHEQMEMFSSLFPNVTVNNDHLMLHGVLPNNIPLEIAIPIDPDPYERRNENRTGIDPEGKYKSVQDYLIKYPESTLQQVADGVGIALSTIYRLERKYGKLQHGVLLEQDPEKKVAIIREYLKDNKRATNAEIARQTGISKTSVNRLMRKYKIRQE